MASLGLPGQEGALNLTPEKRTELDADPQIVVLDINGKPYIKGAQQHLAKEMFAFISGHVRERRANSGKNAMLTEVEFKKHPADYDRYIHDQLAPKESDFELNRHAAKAFGSMRAAAAAQGVSLRVGSSFRARSVAEASAKKAGNKYAVAKFSSHTLGLAVDLDLHTPSSKKTEQWTEQSTRMDNLVKMYGAPAYKWMAEHAAEHGWYPFRMEPWHWEYNPPGFRETFFADADAQIRPSKS